MPAKLFVGNLSFQATEEDLRELFQQSGTVESVRIVTDQFTGRPRGFGFVEMATKEEAAKAVEMLNGRLFRDRNLVVDEARPSPSAVRAVAGLAAVVVVAAPRAGAEAVAEGGGASRFLDERPRSRPGPFYGPMILDIWRLYGSGRCVGSGILAADRRHRRCAQKVKISEA